MIIFISYLKLYDCLGKKNKNKKKLGYWLVQKGLTCSKSKQASIWLSMLS